MPRKSTGPKARATIQKFKAKKIGLAPGSLVHVGEQKVDRPILDFFDYDPGKIDVQYDVGIDACLALKSSSTVSWINLSGIHDIPLLEKIGRAFDLHPLALEDILNTQHRPKLEEFDGYSLIILKMLEFDEETEQIRAEQISLVLTPHCVLSFQERPGDVFDGLRDRLMRSNGRIRHRGTDYLIYGLIDSIVDSYFHILEKLGDRLALLEEQLIDQPDQACQHRIHHFKRELLNLRKLVWPLREVISELYSGEAQLIEETTTIYLRDLKDHVVQILETVELYRDTVSGLLDLYLSSISHRMNEVMQVLTIMASLFIPLTFIVGVYGMNFEHMPELKLIWGYPAVWIVMLGCAGGMLIYFKRKKWF